jgi:RNA-directed DNA polymerase
MHYYHQEKTSLNTAKLAEMARRFEQLQQLSGLAQLLGVPASTIEKIGQKQEYHSFYVPKPGGQKRFIQHPAPALKGLQQTLNKYLQASYYGVRPAAAQGFVICPNDDPRPRNIYTNALMHQQGEWFLNIDLKDFFHSITLTHLRNLYRCVFGFPPELTQTLIQLTAFQGRLPMGAPTSPILSNFVCLFLDDQFQQLANALNATYTRYADDITLSFSAEPPAHLMREVQTIVLRHGFSIQPEKLSLRQRCEQPEITGLIIGEGPTPQLSKNWIKRLKEEIRVLRWLMSEAVRERGLFHAYALEKFRQSIQGQVSFVGFVLGKDTRTYRKLAMKVIGL